MHLDILPQVVLAAVADLRKRSALRANNGDSIPETTVDLAALLLAKNGDPAQVQLRFMGWSPDVAELPGCGSWVFILKRLGWRRRTTFQSLALGRSTGDGAGDVSTVLLLTVLLLTLHQSLMPPFLLPLPLVCTLLTSSARLGWSLVVWLGGVI
jgi:hypothetical protein